MITLCNKHSQFTKIMHIFVQISERIDYDCDRVNYKNVNNIMLINIEPDSFCHFFRLILTGSGQK